LDNADVLVSFVSEAARIDINFASKAMLANLFAGLGADQQAAKSMPTGSSVADAPHGQHRQR